MKKLLIATHNIGKFKEYQIIFGAFLNGLKVELVALKDLGIKEKVEESGNSYKENAVLKAKFYSQFSDLPILADDSGLEIEALGGWPGVKSRRANGYEASDKKLIEIVLNRLEGIPFKERVAKYKVVIALAYKDKIYTYEGKRRGFISENRQRVIWRGFPFDSIFYLPEKKKVFVKLTREEKAEFSHRTIALKKALPILKEILA
ncbi:MAG: non-canonical purine NTP pyrophosphatase [Candidatus Nealsonbacteria bacterium]|nr:MAG: non-canonical purine NTP pyrophosphatase [Candidatus Nealsonbacteria bacterium]